MVNNAGRSQRAVVLQTDLEVDRAILELNFIGTISLTKTLLPYLIKQQSGSIVVVSSIAGKLGVLIHTTCTHAYHMFSMLFSI